ncbi:NAD+ diphosphatase [Sphingomonas gellani]|uniref:NAD(+) diphosphatase n=1 Tax=Sphingomonas gellani TaxID=1166340 RepID=A0A1H8C9E3_9SPHN|nr:NAD(+) diphosphatase [Sphingomonas gellani]SEM91074.1 NAD+ diphosphatase [Sphingomonas gellani]
MSAIHDLSPGFTGGTLDRADALRHDAAALARATADPAARLLRLDALVPVSEGGRLGWTPLADVPSDRLALLGLEPDGAACFVTLPEESATGVAPPAMRSPELMEVLDALAPGEAATYAAARSLILWHARHRHCAVCGHVTHPFRAGWGRSCPHCGAEHFPRTDPVVIMIAEHDGRALLGRQPGWPEGRYSALAGFLEPGESIEEAVAREVLEESGVRVRGVRYVASQPWPFPSQLMIACIAQADSDRLVIDTHELESAIWVSREEVRAVLAGAQGPFLPPPRYAIARTLMEVWAAGG